MDSRLAPVKNLDPAEAHGLLPFYCPRSTSDLTIDSRFTCHLSNPCALYERKFRHGAHLEYSAVVQQLMTFLRYLGVTADVARERDVYDADHCAERDSRASRRNDRYQ